MNSDALTRKKRKNEEGKGDKMHTHEVKDMAIGKRAICYIDLARRKCICCFRCFSGSVFLL
jgi:hypothetical protein